MTEVITVLIMSLALCFSAWRGFSFLQMKVERQVSLERERLSHDHFLAEQAALNPPEPETQRIQAEAKARIDMIKAQAESGVTALLPGTVVRVTCPECGIVFWLTPSMSAQRMRDHKIFYCPNAHEMSYKDKGEGSA